MKKIFASIVTIYISSMSIQVAFAQNARFSQIFSTPVMMNPALAGRFNGNSRAGVLSSWQNSKLASVTHQDAYVDFKLFNKKQLQNDTVIIL